MFANFRVHGLKKIGEALPSSFHVSMCRPVVKALEKVVFNPCTRKSANMGHPSRGKGLVARERFVAQPTHDATWGHQKKHDAICRCLTRNYNFGVQSCIDTLFTCYKLLV